jgi:hypothetical protein
MQNSTLARSFLLRAIILTLTFALASGVAVAKKPRKKPRPASGSATTASPPASATTSNPAPTPAAAPSPAPAAAEASTAAATRAPTSSSAFDNTPSSLPYAGSAALGPSFEGSTAVKLRLEGSMEMSPILPIPNTTFELALPIGLVFWKQSIYSVDVSYFRLEIVPTARLRYPLAKEYGLYADAGLGFVYYSVSSNVPVSSGSGVGGLFKLAAGGYYAFNEHLRAFVEPVGLNFYFGSGSGFVYSILFGGSYRFSM